MPRLANHANDALDVTVDLLEKLSDDTVYGDFRSART